MQKTTFTMQDVIDGKVTEDGKILKPEEVQLEKDIAETNGSEPAVEMTVHEDAISEVEEVDEVPPSAETVAGVEVTSELNTPEESASKAPEEAGALVGKIPEEPIGTQDDGLPEEPKDDNEPTTDVQ